MERRFKEAQDRITVLEIENLRIKDLEDEIVQLKEAEKWSMIDG
jgi:hypothetical protein